MKSATHRGALLVVLAVLGVLALFIGGAAGCSSSDADDDDEAKPMNNGVNDVKLACETRASWQNRTAEKCINCLAAAPTAKCECETFKDFGGLCFDQAEARRLEATCTYEVNLCASRCGQDCTCIDACYANVPTCRRAASAQDGCVAQACADHCR